MESPAEIVVGSRDPVTYRVELRAGAEPARAEVAPRAKYKFGDEHGRQEGMPYTFDGLPEVSGDGVDEGGSVGFGYIACGPSGGAYHGDEPSGATVRVWIPAGGTAMVTLRYRISSTPRWPQTDYRPIIGIAGYDARPEDRLRRPDGPPITPRELLAPPPRVSGPAGVRIMLHTEPVSADRGGGATPDLPAGAPLAIRGETEPPLAGGTMTLRYLAEGKGAHDLAAVALDDLGRFVYRGWRPGDPGYHELAASVDPPAASGLQPDHFCPRAFRIDGSASRSVARQLDVFAARLRRGRRRAVVVVACSGPVGESCAGRVALSTRRRRLGSAPFAVQTGARTRVGLAWRGPARGAVTAVVSAEGAAAVRRGLSAPRRSGRARGA